MLHWSFYQTTRTCWLQAASRTVCTKSGNPSVCAYSVSPRVGYRLSFNNEFFEHVANCSPVQTHGKNIRHYSSYLTERARGYRHSKCDFVRGAENRFQKLTVDKGLLRETELVQLQISALLKCDVSCKYWKERRTSKTLQVLDNEPENEITITVFRMLVLDLLALYHVINQAMIAILGMLAILNSLAVMLIRRRTIL